MNSLGNYLVTAQSFLEGYRHEEKVKELYNQVPDLMEIYWNYLFLDKNSDMVKEFTKLLEEKDQLYIQYETVKLENHGKPANTNFIRTDLRVYEYGSGVGKVACLKVTVYEQ